MFVGTTTVLHTQVVGDRSVCKDLLFLVSTELCITQVVFVLCRAQLFGSCLYSIQLVYWTINFCLLCAVCSEVPVKLKLTNWIHRLCNSPY